MLGGAKIGVPFSMPCRECELEKEVKVKNIEVNNETHKEYDDELEFWREMATKSLELAEQLDKENKRLNRENVELRFDLFERKSINIGGYEMHCSYCGTKIKEITKDVTYDICKNAECRMCEITEPPNMMGDSPRTYDTELPLERWCELLDKTPSDIENLKDSIDDRMIDMNIKFTMLDSITKLTEENQQLKKKNKKLKKKIKKLKREIKCH